MVASIIESVKVWAENVILTTGPSGIGLLMLLDSACIPIPSEVIMPFGGMQAGAGHFNFHVIAWAGTIGSTIGSGLAYGAGRFLGHEFLMKYGKYVLMRPKEIRHAEHWFDKYGLKATLFGRFVPVIRTFISLPAGMFRAPFAQFMLYAFLGALPWCYLWAYIGLKLGENWKSLEGVMKYADVVVGIAIVVIVIRFLRYRFRKEESNEGNGA